VTLQKLTPNQDLQCFFFEPSAIAALSNTSTSGFTVSGTWRQQFDWAVVEWNRDNTHEHPAFRNLPDGDLSGLVLSYQESRTNCIAMDSDLFPTVDWPWLRVWGTRTALGETAEKIWWVPLKDHATPAAGSYQCAYADFTLSGTLSDGDFVGLAYLQQQYTYTVSGSGHIPADAVQALTDAINGSDPLLQAVRTGNTIRVYYTGGGPVSTSTAGANGNVFSMYTFATGTEAWDAEAKTFANGTSPTAWDVTLDFSTLQGSESNTVISLENVPTYNIRKMRWTYAADLQAAAYERSEFEVVISDWTVTGTGRGYSVAGAGSRRIEDDSRDVSYSGTGWATTRGNYSGGSIRATANMGDSVTCRYLAGAAHTLYIGTRYLGIPSANGAKMTVVVDGVTVASMVDLLRGGEDVLIRYPAGDFSTGSHTVTVTHAGPGGDYLYFDFFELAIPSITLPSFTADAQMTLATDWDTEHSLALAPERTAGMIQSLGFTGRQNHYVGALWFYQLANPANVYATGTVTFTGTPAFGDSITVTIGTVGVPSSDINLTKLVHEGMTADMVALAYANELNRGYTSLWASASGGVLTIQARALGTNGDNVSIAAVGSATLTATASGASLADGFDGTWLTDLTASPPVNRAARDWHSSFFAALQGYGIESTAAFSMELGNGDPSVAAGIAQRDSAGNAIVLPTPSIQTNFSPTSLAFWEAAYALMAGLQASAGLTPYLQFGEVQWWYFANDGDGHPFASMPFYDAWNLSQFLAEFGHALATITTNTVNPASYPDEVSYLPGVIGTFTNAIMTFVRTTQPSCRFEVLYPTDVNQSTFNQAINYPASAWTPAALAVLKTENFGFTQTLRSLNAAEGTMAFGQSLGFPASQRAQLVGIGDATTAWLKEAQSAAGKGFESVVLFALDQFCLIGYADPLPQGLRRSVRMGS
jgi:hypothetical protein